MKSEIKYSTLWQNCEWHSYGTLRHTVNGAVMFFAIKCLINFPFHTVQGAQSHFYSCDHMGRQRKAPMDNCPKNKNQGGQKPQSTKYFNTLNTQGVQSLFYSSDHMMQAWTIPILFMRSCVRGGEREKGLNINGQKPHRTTAPRIKVKDKTPNPEKIQCIQCTIP